MLSFLIRKHRQKNTLIVFLFSSLANLDIWCPCYAHYYYIFNSAKKGKDVFLESWHCSYYKTKFPNSVQKLKHSLCSFSYCPSYCHNITLWNISLQYLLPFSFTNWICKLPSSVIGNRFNYTKSKIFNIFLTFFISLCCSGK